MSVHELPLLPEVSQPRPPPRYNLFRDAMACLGAAVNIITTDGPAGTRRLHRQRGVQRHRFTADAAGVPQPRRVRLADVQRKPHPVREHPERRAGAAVESVWRQNADGGTLCRRPLADGRSGCPRLEEALASFDCRISQVVSVGTHDILFCDMMSMERHDAPPGLVWFDRGYHALSRQDAR